ncbi:uncharacterized protein LOC128226869 isoform X1 [Mya arenaria]|uniref:uncharacterized protein LOC128226869 isoform X1 n=1 Tax=Mya arenaria TaxID=6604 RepID=UPI0022DF4804|nr:uncharacterized protein LOC128226869 isoform X1 [Mya arenaria]XP_052792919.1 uncharacterized protein LOC128226869 isoform X1 [Mya arenaria]XP_052792920.1 uncharacterized protein LOC128226869 isoform X1 [Mya arenaria]XP_052792921.1 uncharacterized protein LOC128226869 isoform X1 [Mya arenaria]
MERWISMICLVVLLLGKCESGPVQPGGSSDLTVQDYGDGGLHSGSGTGQSVASDQNLDGSQHNPELEHLRDIPADRPVDTDLQDSSHADQTDQAVDLDIQGDQHSDGGPSNGEDYPSYPVYGDHVIDHLDPNNDTEVNEVHHGHGDHTGGHSEVDTSGGFLVERHNDTHEPFLLDGINTGNTGNVRTDPPVRVNNTPLTHRPFLMAGSLEIVTHRPEEKQAIPVTEEVAVFTTEPVITTESRLDTLEPEHSLDNHGSLVIHSDGDLTDNEMEGYHNEQSNNTNQEHKESQTGEIHGGVSPVLTPVVTTTREAEHVEGHQVIQGGGNIAVIPDGSENMDSGHGSGTGETQTGVDVPIDKGSGHHPDEHEVEHVDHGQPVLTQNPTENQRRTQTLPPFERVESTQREIIVTLPTPVMINVTETSENTQDLSSLAHGQGHIDIVEGHHEGGIISDVGRHNEGEGHETEGHPDGEIVHETPGDGHLVPGEGHIESHTEGQEVIKPVKDGERKEETEKYTFETMVPNSIIHSSMVINPSRTVQHSKTDDVESDFIRPVVLPKTSTAETMMLPLESYYPSDYEGESLSTTFEISTVMRTQASVTTTETAEIPTASILPSKSSAVLTSSYDSPAIGSTSISQQQSLVSSFLIRPRMETVETSYRQVFTSLDIGYTMKTISSETIEEFTVSTSDFEEGVSSIYVKSSVPSYIIPAVSSLDILYKSSTEISTSCVTSSTQSYSLSLAVQSSTSEIHSLPMATAPTSVSTVSSTMTRQIQPTSTLPVQLSTPTTSSESPKVSRTSAFADISSSMIPRSNSSASTNISSLPVTSRIEPQLSTVAATTRTTRKTPGTNTTSHLIHRTTKKIATTKGSSKMENVTSPPQLGPVSPVITQTITRAGQTTVAMAPSVFIQLSLRMSWLEFCDTKTSFFSSLSQALHIKKSVLVDIGQFKMTNIPEQYCEGGDPVGLEGEQYSEITVEMYIVDQDGKVDITLTIDASRVLEKDFQDSSSIYKDKIVTVKFQDRRPRTPEPEVSKASKFTPPSGVTMVVVIASVGGVCCVALVILQVVLLYRRVKAKKKQRVFFRQQASIQSMDHVALGVIPKSRPGSGYWNPGLDDHKELPEPEEYSRILNYSSLANQCMDPTAIHAEFQTIPNDNTDPAIVPVGDEDKNRYANVLPHKNTRVKLERADKSMSDYINANYVNGYMGEKCVYIATQSPLVNTVEDFWTMVWQQQSRVILMLNPLTPNGKPKYSTCYWPDSLKDDKHREFGDYMVTLKKRDVQHDYVECTLEIMDLERNLKREVKHFQLTCWPEARTPEPLAFVKFVLDTRPLYENTGKPAILHCGPGTGRTCTLIAVDMCMRMYEDRRRVDILNCVHRMRSERAGAVQSKEQYALIYQALNEYAVILSSPSVSTRSSVITLHAML